MLDKDIELLEKAQKGDQFAMDSILAGNKGLVSTIARKYFLIGGEKEDLIQEGMIGFFRAITTFDKSKNVDFKNYAIKLIEREIVSAIRSANSNKKKTLVDTVFIEDEDNIIDEDCPETSILSEESENEFLDDIYSHLSEFESEVVSLYLDGYSYRDIARNLSVEEKAIDNALSRIKNKLKYLKERL